MDFISNQASTLTAKAITTINNLTTNRRNNPKEETDETATNQEPQTSPSSEPSSQDNRDQPASSDGGNKKTKQKEQQKMTTSIYYKKTTGGFGGDLDFGGASQPAQSLPPIGFKSDFLPMAMKQSASMDLSAIDRGLPQSNDFSMSNNNVIMPRRQENIRDNFWSGSWFQRLLILTVLRLCVFIRKVYEDYETTKMFHQKQIINSFLLSLASIALPTLVFTIYRVCRYMQTIVFVEPKQLALSMQSTNTLPMPPDNKQYSSSPVDPMVGASASKPSQDEQDGLVTARQSPSDESFAEQNSPSPAPTLPAVNDITKSNLAIVPINHEQHIEAVSIENLQNLPDKETVSLLMGGLAQLVHGGLFVFWQLKRQVDLISFLSIRCCFWRAPRQEEQVDVNKLSCFSDGLEFFEDFYAGFLGVLIQVAHIASSHKEVKLASDGEVANPVAFAKQQGTKSENLIIMSELMVSLLVVWSLLIAVRRRDDGPLSMVLSVIGWGSVFTSRIIIIAMSTLYFHYYILLFLIAHVAGISYWIYCIALNSHNGLDNEENLWLRHKDDPETQPESNVENKEVPKSDCKGATTTSGTDSWTRAQHVTLITQIVTLFGLPSLFYWPFMFQLRMAYRPFIYMTVIMAENFLLVSILYLGLSPDNRPHGHLYFLAIVAVTSIIGFIFLSCYIGFKPKFTDQFARFDMVVNEAETSGIYYEFCSRVFKLADVTHTDFKRLANQQEISQEESDDN